MQDSELLIPQSFDVASLRQSAWLGNLADDVLAAIAVQFDQFALNSGEILFRQGELGDSLYLIVSGRVRILVSTSTGERAVGELGAGEIVGEMSVLCDEPRSATVIAVRDTQLARLSKEAFEQIPGPCRRALDGIFIRQLAARLRAETAGTGRARPPLRSISLVPISPGAPIDDFSRLFSNALGSPSRVLRLDSCEVEKLSALTGAAESSPGDRLHGALTNWLNLQEIHHSKVVYVADRQDSPWTARCIRQSDLVLLIASRIDSLEDTRRRAKQLLELPGMREKRRILVLLYFPGDGEPFTTRAWLDAIPCDRHLHIRMNRAADFERLSRFVHGKSVGLVLGAGAARGIGHVGVIQAMRELGIPIDMVGGTSIGAVVGGLCALEWSCERILKESCDGSARSLRNDYTLPIVSVLTGRKQSSIVRKLAGERGIEDTWIPFFCVSASLTTCDMKVHLRGDAATAVVASARIPGLLPPLAADGELLVDGGLVNMVPADVMQELAEGGHVIAVAVSPRERFDCANFGNGVSGWRQLARRLTFSKSGKMPSFREVLMRTVEFGRTPSTRGLSSATMKLTLPVEQFGFGDFPAGKQIANAGYRYAKEYFENWLREFGSPWMNFD
jgi:predicted acylesterase/phospholipase RssA